MVKYQNLINQLLTVHKWVINDLFSGGPPNLKGMTFCHSLNCQPNICAKFEWNWWFEQYHHLPGSAWFSHGEPLLKVEFDYISLYSDSSGRCNIMENVLKSVASLVSYIITQILMFIRSSFPRETIVIM